jgi:precorrin-6A/cobalt-precorrin-6A reductase
MQSVASPAGGVLVLGGTAEARELASRLEARGARVVSSLAGRVSGPKLPPGEVRIGGFGGVEGLKTYLREQDISAVVDATHPFAARITANAEAACRLTGTPLIVLRRPAWTPVDGDRWYPVRDLAAAARTVGDLTGPDGRVLLTTGRRDTAPFSALPQRFWLRAVETPTGEIPVRCEIILDRGPFDVDGERRLLGRLAIEVLVTKNSGGLMTAAKLTAARELAIAVIMVERPPRPTNVQIVDDATAALTWLARLRSAR